MKLVIVESPTKVPIHNFSTYYCYIIKSVNFSRYYIGATENLRQRILQHNQGRSISTKRYRPWKLVYAEKFTDLKQARKREKQVKAWKSRAAIEKLANRGSSIL